MRAPLTVLTSIFTLAFLDGALAWGLPDSFYTLVGIGFMISLGWMWVIELKK